MLNAAEMKIIKERELSIPGYYVVISPSFLVTKHVTETEDTTVCLYVYYR